LYYRGEKEDRELILLYVDDIIIETKSKEQTERIKQTIRGQFSIKVDTLHYYIGMQVEQLRHSTKLNQTIYIDKIFQRSHAEPSLTVNTPMSTQIKLTRDMQPKTEQEEKQLKGIDYRSGVSSLMYAALLTRPDIAYATNVTARFMENPGHKHNQAMLRIFQYINNTRDKCIEYSRPTDESLVNQLICYTDISHAHMEYATEDKKWTDA
jgi:hypothetical protein